MVNEEEKRNKEVKGLCDQYKIGIQKHLYENVL